MSTHMLLVTLVVVTTSAVLGGCSRQPTAGSVSVNKPSQAQINAEVEKINQNPAISPQQKQAAIAEVKRRLGATD